MAKPTNSDKNIKGKILNNVKTIKGNVKNVNTAIKGSLSSGITDASTTKKGIIRIATDEEAIEGTSANTAITPHTLRLVTNYVHEQGEASNVWIINHNLNKRPQITVTDSAGNVQSGVEKYIDDNTVEIYFNNKFKGTAILT